MPVSWACARGRKLPFHEGPLAVARGAHRSEQQPDTLDREHANEGTDHENNT